MNRRAGGAISTRSSTHAWSWIPVILSGTPSRPQALDGRGRSAASFPPFPGVLRILNTRRWSTSLSRFLWFSFAGCRAQTCGAKARPTADSRAACVWERARRPPSWALATSQGAVRAACAMGLQRLQRSEPVRGPKHIVQRLVHAVHLPVQTLVIARYRQAPEHQPGQRRERIHHDLRRRSCP